jgi:phage repressor protein C with HTH and peptisase S24 domain
MQLQDWTRQKIEQYGSINAVAKRLGVVHKTISDWSKGILGGTLSEKSLQAIAREEGKTSEEIRNLFGLPDVSSYFAGLHQQRGAGARAFRDDEMIEIPLYSIRVGAGNGATPEHEEVKTMLAFPKEWIIKKLKLNPETLEAVEVMGDSMLPLRSGDIVLIDRSDKTVRDGVFVLRIDGELWVKRLARLPGAKVLVKSDNPSYESFTLDLKELERDIEILGKVVFAMVEFN